MKSIKIPKTEQEWTPVTFNKTGIIITKNGAVNMKLKSQIIENTLIPSMEIWASPMQILYDFQSSLPKAELRKDKINEILRTITIRNL